MKPKKFTIPVAVFILTLILFSLYRINGIKDQEYSQTFYALGTVNKVDIYEMNKSKSEKILTKCGSILRNIDNEMSTKIASSEVNKINEKSGESSVKVSDETYEVIKRSIEYAKITDGHFDSTIGPLSSLWAIGTDEARVPTKDEIDTLLPLVSYKNVELDDKTSSVKLLKNGMKLDLGAIAKGYAADVVADYLKSQGVKRSIVNLGGNLYIIGTKEDGDEFNIGIQDPNRTDGNAIGSIRVSDKSVVTSGIYERYIEKDGKMYHHLLNPATGYPYDNNLSSVSIISTKSIDCDALSTSVFGLGLEDGLKLVNSLDGVDAVVVTNDKKIYLSKGLEGKMKITNSNYELIGQSVD
ncbi:MAG: FAD:protein FMN transferase [Clostridioides sp.]|jgi:thiamine biosynthesis lipoprotein|nr:FAD:protein FMN transferase [Clostridioides sp.]